MDKITSSILTNLCSTNRQTMEEAFNLIYKKYSPLIYYVSFDILKVKEDVEDIVNETFLRMYSKRHNLTDEKSLKQYLVTIARNLSIDRIKELSKTAQLDVEVADVSENNLAGDFNALIGRFAEYLDSDELYYVSLHLLYGFSFRDISNMKRVTTSVISSKYRRAIQKMKKHYKEVMK